MDQPSVSIVVPTYNRLPQLKHLVNALRKQDYPSHLREVVVVDDGSDDGTADWLSTEVNCWDGDLLYITQANQYAAAARNRGISASQGEIVALIDDDCIPARNWLTMLISGFTSPEIVGVGGKVEGTRETIVQSYIDDAYHNPPETIQGQIAYLYTGNAAFRREALSSVGGFTEVLQHAEDVDLGLRLLEAGWRLVYCPNAIVTHHHRSTVFGLCQMFLHYGQGAYYCHREHGYPALEWSLYAYAFSVAWWPVSVARRLREGLSFKQSIIYPILQWLRNLAYVCGVLTGPRKYGLE